LRRLLVIDAVDETDRPDELVARVLSPLAVACGEDGGPLCRILVSGRDEPHLRPLIEAAAVVGGLTDLGAIPRRQLRPALTAYVKELLGHGTPYERLPYAPAADVLAEAIAGTLTAGPGTDGRSGSPVVGRVPGRWALRPVRAGPARPFRSWPRPENWVRRCRVICGACLPWTWVGQHPGWMGRSCAQ